MIFEALIAYLIRRYRRVNISTGLLYGHKMIKMNGFQFTELSDGSVSVDLEDKMHLTFANADCLISFVKNLNLYAAEEQGD